jgi:hypothetical protein
MNTRHVLVAAIGVLSGRAAHAQSLFEGIITMRVGSSAQPQEIVYMSRAGNTRIDAGPGGIATFLRLVGENRAYVLLPAQRSYSELTFSVDSGRAAATESAPVVTRRGTTATIAGYPCEQVAYTAPNGTLVAEACVTDKLGPWMDPSSGLGGGRMAAWRREIMNRQEFPLRVTDGNGQLMMEVTSVQRKRMSDTLFRIPRSYTKVDMPAPGRRPPGR